MARDAGRGRHLPQLQDDGRGGKFTVIAAPRTPSPPCTLATSPSSLYLLAALFLDLRHPTANSNLTETNQPPPPTPVLWRPRRARDPQVRPPRRPPPRQRDARPLPGRGDGAAHRARAADDPGAPSGVDVWGVGLKKDGTGHRSARQKIRGCGSSRSLQTASNRSNPNAGRRQLPGRHRGGRRQPQVLSAGPGCFPGEGPLCLVGGGGRSRARARAAAAATVY